LLEAGADASAVHDVITVLRRQVLGCIGPDSAMRDRAENMFQEVRLVTSEAMERAQAGRRSKAERLASSLAATSCELAAVVSLNEFRGVVARRFAELGISSCYVSVYEDGPRPDGAARLVLAWDQEGARTDAVLSTFPSANLAPDAWLGTDRSRSYAVMAAHFDGQPIGIMAVSLEAPGYLYDALGDMIGMSLDRIRRFAKTAAPLESGIEQ
jgi:hypothetical protein